MKALLTGYAFMAAMGLLIVALYYLFTFHPLLVGGAVAFTVLSAVAWLIGDDIRNS